jgi:hypothetical protein
MCTPNTAMYLAVITYIKLQSAACLSLFLPLTSNITGVCCLHFYTGEIHTLPVAMLFHIYSGGRTVFVIKPLFSAPIISTFWCSLNKMKLAD